MKRVFKIEDHSKLSSMLVLLEPPPVTEFSVLSRVLLMVEFMFPTTPRDSQVTTLKRQLPPLEREERLLKRAKLLLTIMLRNTEITFMVSTFKDILTTSRRKTRIDIRLNSINGMPTLLKLRLALLKLFTKNSTLILERIPRELRMRRKLPQSERPSAKTKKVMSNKIPRTENGPSSEDLPENKETKELEQRSKPLSQRKHELIIIASNLISSFELFIHQLRSLFLLKNLCK